MKICLVLTEPTLEANEELVLANAPWIDMAELRADKLEPSQWDRLVSWKGVQRLPMILTLRRPEDGGDWIGPEEVRTAFFRNQVTAGWQWWDIEEAYPLPETLELAFKKEGGRIVRSFHDFDGIPSDWNQKVRQISLGGDIPKAAVTPRSVSEVRTLFQVCSAWDGFERVVLGMGPFGTSTRVLGAELGSLWTYAAPKGRPAAPGQWDPETLHELMAADRRQSGDPIFGIAGNPVGHSLSPLIHNTGFRRLGFPHVYLPFLTDDFSSLMNLADDLGIEGLSVTIPHKETAARFSDRRDHATEASGACNTLVRRPEGWYGHNTDAPGFLRPLLRVWGKENLRGAKVTVIGTGGAARGILFALQDAMAEILLLGRTPRKLEDLAHEFGVPYALLQAESTETIQRYNDAVIQTTSAGMGSQEGVDPVSWYPWTGKEIAFDIVYKPLRTAFLARAEECGCRTISGWQMFVEQAKEQFRLFTGHEYPGDFPAQS